MKYGCDAISLASMQFKKNYYFSSKRSLFIMNNQIDTAALVKGLDIVELEERLEMVQLAVVESEPSGRCDVTSFSH